MAEADESDGSLLFLRPEVAIVEQRGTRPPRQLRLPRRRARRVPPLRRAPAGGRPAGARRGKRRGRARRVHAGACRGRRPRRRRPARRGRARRRPRQRLHACATPPARRSPGWSCRCRASTTSSTRSRRWRCCGTPASRPRTRRRTCSRSAAPPAASSSSASTTACTIVDDYAHHPTEITATLTAAMKGGHERVIAVFQPHLFSRTRYLQREFGRALTLADEAIVTEIFPAREEPEPGVSGKLIVDAYLAERPGGPVSFLPRLSDVVARLAPRVRPRRPRAHPRRRRRLPRRRAAPRHARGARGRGAPAPNSQGYFCNPRPRAGAMTRARRASRPRFRLLPTVSAHPGDPRRAHRRLRVGPQLVVLRHQDRDAGRRAPRPRQARPASSCATTTSATTCSPSRGKDVRGTLAAAVASSPAPRWTATFPHTLAVTITRVPAGGLRAGRRPLVRGRRERLRRSARPPRRPPSCPAARSRRRAAPRRIPLRRARRPRRHPTPRPAATVCRPRP